MSQISTDLPIPSKQQTFGASLLVRGLVRSVTARLRQVPLLRHVKRKLVHFEHAPEETIYRQSDVAQKSLIAAWKQLYAAGVVLPFDQVGFSRFSEFEEDGYLLYILTLAGSISRTVVEISSQDGRVCMATNLIIHHRWRGFLFDGDPLFVAEGQRFFANHPATRAAPPAMASEWFSRDNVNDVLRAAGVPNEVDVLSLDIDGNDLYLWSAMTLRPRVLICEFNNAVPSDLSLTIPYRPDFDFTFLPKDHAFFRSASLAAYVAVCRCKGYRLVAINALGFNAIFLRDDVLAKEMPEIPASILDDHAPSVAVRAEWWPRLAHLPWSQVSVDGQF